MFARTTFVSAALILAGPALAYAQGVVYSSVKLVTVGGTVESVGKSGIVAKVNGKSQPVPMSPQTNFSVQAIGDAGFVRVGTTITASGVVVPGGGLANASITVHANPAITAPQKIVSVNSDAKSMSLNGVVINLNPLTINSTDLFRPTIKQAGVGVRINVPPVPGGSFLVQPNEKSKEKVTVVMGPVWANVSPGDHIDVTFSENNPAVAYRVVVTKKDEISSTEIAAGAKAAKKK